MCIIKYFLLREEIFVKTAFLKKKKKKVPCMILSLISNYLCKYDICDFIRLLLIEYPIKARKFPALHFDWLNAHDDTMI